MSRRTEQREAILHTLAEAEGPLTAQEVHDRARAVHPTIGLATVYRNLSSLEQDGAVVAVHLPQDATRYETAGRGHHHHFRCVKCQTVFEIEGSCPVALLEGATLPGGLTVLGHELVFFGKCASCADAAGRRAGAVAGVA
ncbi:MAG: transcriptional repressor [Trueperaceae bacterium]|jgi:Fur family ferric uptake transcriptional regulator